ncbi:MAG: leucine-rich repeat domain-containing protein, partial [Chitinophagaceae bacterium]|nr:leucine-rich repeat domain-containing protein [Chitinophagaceae bacterium]
MKIAVKGEFSPFQIKVQPSLLPASIPPITGLAHILIEENRRNKNPKLDLSKIGMDYIPDEFSNMEWLEELIIGGELYWDFIQERRIVTANSGTFNHFTSIPSSISKLYQLRKLIIAGSKGAELEIEDFSPLASLINLEYLFIENTKLSFLSRVLSPQFTKLKVLSFYNNNISAISVIGELPALQYLVLSENPISAIDSLRGLLTIKYLSVRDTFIESIEALQLSRQLEKLIVSNTMINKIDSVASMSRLEMLNFSNTKVDDISPLANLEVLSYVAFRGCSVTILKPLSGLYSLNSFDCKNNPISDCPADIYESGDPMQLVTYYAAKIEEHNETKTPVKNRKKRKSTNEPSVAQEDFRRDIKLIILGNSNGGKTNLVSFLESGKFDGYRNTTHGLEVHRWLPDNTRYPSLKDVAVSIWDFGGQEYYHGAYRLFLSDNALYLLLWCKDTNSNASFKATLQEGGTDFDIENFELRYWLDTISHYAGARTISKNKPTSAEEKKTTRLIALQNKVDNPDRDKVRIPQDIHDQYFIDESFHVSLKEGSIASNKRQNKALNYFLSELEDAIQNRADTERVPPKWQQIRNAILKLRDSPNARGPFEKLQQNLWVELKDFREACDSFLTTPLTDGELHTVPRWLDKGGTVVFFPEIDALKDKIFLKPDQLAKTIYQVLNDDVRKAGGEFTESQIKLGDESTTKIFIELALRLEMIFPHPVLTDSTWYLAPQYLPDAHPIEDLFKIASNGAWQSDLWVKIPLFYYRKVLHELLIHFASPLSGASCRYFWKHGIMFVKDELRVLIKGLYPQSKQSEGVILIGVEKNSQLQSLLQNEIFQKIRIIMNLSSDMPDKEVEMDPMDCSSSSNDEKASKQSYSREIQVSYNGTDYICYSDLLHNANEPKINSNERNVPLLTYKFSAILPTPPQRAKKVFLSYS